MSSPSEQRLAEVTALFSALNGCWAPLAGELNRLRDQHIDSLVSADDEQVRGRIKQIDDLLRMPAALQQEMRMLSEPLPDQGG